MSEQDDRIIVLMNESLGLLREINRKLDTARRMGTHTQKCNLLLGESNACNCMGWEGCQQGPARA